jgi:hypothetical protein
MRIPFLAGSRSSGDDPERKKLLVAEGRVPRPFPGPWTLRALVRGDAGGEPVEPSARNPVEDPGVDPGEDPGDEGRADHETDRMTPSPQ